MGKRTMFGRSSSGKGRLMPSHHSSRRGLLALAVGLLALGAVPAGALAQAKLPGTFRGEAYGTAASVEAGPIAATLGRSAFLPCPCRGTNGKTLTNNVASVDAGDVLGAGAVTSTLLTKKGATTASMVTTSEVTGLSLFDGLITASAVKAVSKTNANTTTLSANGNDSQLVNLRIGGRLIDADVEPNTKLQLAGLGTVTLKRTVTQKSGNASIRQTVEMLVIDVTVANRFGLGVGAKIVVAHAASGYARSQPPAAFSGQAYITDANALIGEELRAQIGKAAFVSIGCQGTNGQTLTNNVTGAEVDGLFRLGAGETTAFSGQTSNGQTARTTAEVARINLLGGLITADGLKAVAEESVRDGVRTRSTAGSTFLRLRILGVLPLPVNIAKNTRVPLLGLGFVVINEQITPAPGGGRTQANALRIVVETANNRFDLPVGTQIVIGHADALAQKF